MKKCKTQTSTTKKAIQWENVSDVYPNLLVELIEAAIDVGEREIVTSGMITLGSMCDDVANSVTLGVKQKGRILSVQLYNAQKLGVRALTQLDQPSSMVLYPLSASRSGKWLHVGDPWAKQALTHLCEAIISLAEIHRLQRYTINELGRIGRGLVRHVGDRELCAEALIVIARTLETVAAALAPPSSRGDMHLIRETASQLASIQRWFVNNHVSAKAVETAVANSLSNIERVVTASATNSALHMVSWQDLTSMGSESTPDENI